MKRFLKKKWLGLPVGIITVALLVFLLAGGVLAATGAFEVFRVKTKVSVLEPLEVTEIQAPGEFWDWGNPEDPVQSVDIYAGMDLGLQGYGGKYLIHNLIPSENARGMACPTQFVEVTVTVSETTGQTDWYGLRGCYSTVAHEATSHANYENPIRDMYSGALCWTNPGEVHTCTFLLGNHLYPIETLGNEVLEDSSSALFFVEAKVADNADLIEPLNFIVTVSRGH